MPPTTTGAARPATGRSGASPLTMPTRAQKPRTSLKRPSSSCTRGTPIRRKTIWTASGYKGRVLEYMHQYAAAIATFDSVIANGPYALEVSFDRVWTGFNQYADGPETILAYQASVNDGEPNGNNSNYGERLNLPHS